MNRFILAFISQFIVCSIAQEILSTDYNCANLYSSLECPKDHMIIVSHTEHKYSPSECVDYYDVDFESKDKDPLTDCVGIIKNDKTIEKSCNGQQTCHIKVKKYDHSLGHYGTNCEFTSNIYRVFYTCVPVYGMDKSIKSFDICDINGPETISGLDRGFISSPNYPFYYGNNRQCLLNIGVPREKRLVIYLISKSLEEKSSWQDKVNDYLKIENGFEMYGFSRYPVEIYEGSDREKVQIKFKSDWLTSAALLDPKGFLLYFELFPLTAPTKSTTTTTTAATTTSSTTISTEEPTTTTTEAPSTTQDFIVENLKQVRNSVGSDIRQDKREDNDQIATIIAILVGLIGILIIVIFSLLLILRRRKQKDPNEDENIYDVTSTNYNDDYNNESISSKKQIDLDESKLQHQQQQRSNKFNDRLKSFYSNINKTLHLSSHILNESRVQIIDSNKETEKLKNSEFRTTSTKSKIFNVNEFNPNDDDCNYEKDIKIDKLKLCKGDSVRSTSAHFKRSNLEYEQEIQKRDDKRLENTYVSYPLGDTENNDNKLQIYEVNFDKDHAYITNSSSKLRPEQQLQDKSIINDDISQVIMNSSNRTNNNDDTEIYQSISDDEDDDVDEETINQNHKKLNCNKETTDNTTIAADNDDSSLIYSMPTNRELIVNGSSDKCNENKNNNETDA